VEQEGRREQKMNALPHILLLLLLLLPAGGGP
jgi:hypothetical protein